MYEVPIKSAGVTAIAAASGAASVINEGTLIPLGIFIVAATVLVGAAWRLSSAVTRAADKLDNMDKRLTDIEQKCNGSCANN